MLKKSVMIAGAVLLVIGSYSFMRGVLWYDILSEPIDITRIVVGTLDYITCENWPWQSGPFGYGGRPCLNGHTQGWDLIFMIIPLIGLALVIYGFYYRKEFRSIASSRLS